MASPRLLRSKRKLSQQLDDSPALKNRCFSNLTNFKSPKSRKAQENKITNHFQTVSKVINESAVSSSAGNQISTQKETFKEFKKPLERKSASFEVVKPKVEIEDLETSSQIIVSQIPSHQLPTSSDGATKMALSIKKVLQRNLMDVSKRLQLKSIPGHLYDLKTYHKTSQKHQIQFTTNENEYMAKSYLKEDRHYQFLHFVRSSMCGQQEFPGPNVIRGILELILRVTNNKELKSTIPVDQTITDLHSLFTCILENFPTRPLKDSYLDVLQSPFQVNGMIIPKTSKNRGVFMAMLDLITDLIHHDNQETKTKPKQQDQEKLTNFYCWDAQCEEQSSFANFSRNEKFERVFLVLDLIVRVLESDLAMFVVQYSHRLSAAIDNERSCPLFRKVIWSTNENISVINSTIKNLISNFIKMIGLNYPKTKIQIMSRLINLVTQLVNLHEYPEETFEYPNYNQGTISLTHEIHKTLENSIHYNSSLVIKVVQHIQSPLIQMQIISKALESLHKVTYPMSLQTSYDLIRRKGFAKFEDVEKADEVNDEKYLKYNPRNKSDFFVITQREYLTLLKLNVEAINNFYLIKDCCNEIHYAKEEEPKEVPSVAESFNHSKFLTDLEEVDMNESVKLRCVDVKYKKLFHVKMNSATYEFYRHEIKHFMLFKKLIKTCHQKYGQKFDELMKFVEA